MSAAAAAPTPVDNAYVPPAERSLQVSASAFCTANDAGKKGCRRFGAQPRRRGLRQPEHRLLDLERRAAQCAQDLLVTHAAWPSSLYRASSALLRHILESVRFSFDSVALLRRPWTLS